MYNSLKRTLAASIACIMAVFSGCSADSGTEKTTEPSESAVQTSEEAKEESSSADSWDELDQSEITAAMGMGWNLGNQLEASNGGIPSETAWGNPEITEDLIKTVKEQGFSTVRIPVSYLLKIGEAPDYTIDEEWLNRVQEVVDYVVDNDMYAVVNMHGDGYYTVSKSWLLCVEDEAAQVEIKAKYEAVWGQIAERFKDYDEHLIFESMNEEFDNTYGKPDPYGYENINAYNSIFVDTVRKTGSNNAKRWLLIPGWNTNIEHTAGNYGFVIPEDSLCEADGKRLMISVHYYDPYNFTLDENISSAKTQWGKYAVENYDSWGQEDYVDSQMKKLNDAFVSQGYPVVIGEMGVQDKTFMSESANEFRRYWCEYVVKAAKANGCIPVYWDNGWNGDKGFGLIDRKTLEVTQLELIEAMIRAISSDDYEIAAPAGFEQ
ncbi:MAG: glycoside hydrolase family 5 protein [Huintestinicola sp.]